MDAYAKKIRLIGSVVESPWKICIGFVKLCEAKLWSISLLNDLGRSVSNVVREIEIVEAKL